MAAETFEPKTLHEINNDQPEAAEQEAETLPNIEQAQDNLALLNKLGAQAVASDTVPPVMEWGYGRSKRTAGLS